MNSSPVITLGIPAYGRAGYLREAIKSCLAQDYTQVEILVADDASPQDPWPEIADLASDRWTYVRHAQNKGGPGNYNYLIERARGEIFILHQDDDCLHPGFCRRAAEALVNHPEAVFYSGLMLRGPQAEGVMGIDLKPFVGPWLPLNYLESAPHLIESLDALLMLLFSVPFMHPAVAMRRDSLRETGGYFEKFMFASDNITLSRMLLQGPAVYDTRLSGYFRVHRGNCSGTLSLSRQYTCRRYQIDLLLPQIIKKFPDWRNRLTQLLRNLSRLERWRILTEAVEAGYPTELLKAAAEAMGGNSHKTLLRTRIFKASWAQQWKSRRSLLKQTPPK